VGVYLSGPTKSRRVAPGAARIRRVSPYFLLSLPHTERSLNPHEIRAKSGHRRFVHFLTSCGAFPVRPEPFDYAQDRLRGAKSKATGLVPSLLFDFAAGAATLRANGECVLKEFHTVPMSCGSI